MGAHRSVCTVSARISVGMLITAAFWIPIVQEVRAQASAPNGVRRAVPYRHRAMSMDEQLGRLTSRLSLTTDQQIKIRRILEHRQALAMQVKAEPSLSAIDRMLKLQANNRAAVDAITSELTDTQRQTYQAMLRPPDASAAPKPQAPRDTAPAPPVQQAAK